MPFVIPIELINTRPHNTDALPFWHLQTFNLQEVKRKVKKIYCIDKKKTSDVESSLWAFQGSEMYNRSTIRQTIK